MSNNNYRRGSYRPSPFVLLICLSTATAPSVGASELYAAIGDPLPPPRQSTPTPAPKTAPAPTPTPAPVPKTTPPPKAEPLPPPTATKEPEPASEGIGTKHILIGAGIAAALAVVAGGGGGTTPNH